MGYIEITDLVKYLPAQRVLELADAEEDATLADPGADAGIVLQGVIDSASREADRYFGKIGPVPVAVVTESLAMAIGLMAIYYLYSRKPDQYENSTNPFSSHYDAQIAWLEEVSTTDLSDGSATGADAGGCYYEAHGDPVMFEGGLDDF